MATTKEYRNYVEDRLSFLGNILIRPMMGEYLLYYQDKLIGGIYDNRVLLKRTDSSDAKLNQLEIPYDGAKEMLFLEDLEQEAFIKDLFDKMILELPDKKVKK